MNKFLVTACIFGLLLSSAFAQEKSPEQLREESSRVFGIEGLQTQTFTRFVAAGTKQRIGFYADLNPIALPLATSTSVSPNNPNMAQWKL